MAYLQGECSYRRAEFTEEKEEEIQRRSSAVIENNHSTEIGAWLTFQGECSDRHAEDAGGGGGESTSVEVHVLNTPPSSMKPFSSSVPCSAAPPVLIYIALQEGH